MKLSEVREEDRIVIKAILEEILIEGKFYRKYCHRCMYWHAKRGCRLDWHGCYYVQEELEKRIEAIQKNTEPQNQRPYCTTCPFQKHIKNCRMLCTKQVLAKQGVSVMEVTGASV